MLLKRLQIHNIGPFTFPAEIEFQEDVTVLTGANDTGKSVVLRILSHIGSRKAIGEDEVNQHYLYQSNTGKTWSKDENILCVATYRLSSTYRNYVPSTMRNLEPPEQFEIEVAHYLAPDVRKDILRALYDRRKNARQTLKPQVRMQKLPLTLYISSLEEIEPELDIAHPKTRAGALFISLAFGANAGERMSALSSHNRLLALRQAAKELDELASQILPSSLDLHFTLDWVDVQSTRVLISLEDNHGEIISIERRGGGVRKIITLLALLFDAAKKAERETIWILIDEPENSLHADAQHRLRTFLEQIAQSDRIQVVYVTHSPSMLNSLRPYSIRLLSRGQKQGLATSYVENRPYDGNFHLVRSSLGLSPSDSLLYAPVTVVVEGITELIAIPYVLQELEKQEIPEFEGATQLLSLSHFLVGQGSSLVYSCQFAKSQGAEPIFFVDGDMEKRVAQAKVRQKCAGVKVISLGDNREFEDLISLETYFRGLRAYFRNEQLSVEEFQRWKEREKDSNPIIAKLGTSKQVERWLETRGIHTYRKPEVMYRALREMSDVSKEIDIGPFTSLIRAMRAAVKNVG